MWELDYKESWVLKNWCFWTVVLEKTLESPLECKVIKAINPKGNQSWISIGRTEAEAAAPILWPPDGKNWLTGKYPDAGKDWRQEEKGLQRMRWLDDIADLKDMSLRRIRELAMENETQGTAVHGVAKRWTRLWDWTELNAACGILAPQPRIEPMAPALGAQSLNHWTTREVQDIVDEMRKELTKLKEELIDSDRQELNKSNTT